MKSIWTNFQVWYKPLPASAYNNIAYLAFMIMF